MRFSPLGKIFDPRDYQLPNNCELYAQSPQAIVLEDRVRIYFSTRSFNEDTKMYLSHVCYVDFDKSFQNILKVSSKPVIGLGKLGCFDEHGIFPFSPFLHDGKFVAYTCGWNRRVSVPVETSTGYVVSEDQGESFKRLFDGPILSSSLKEPFLVGDSFVKHFDNKFRMWYIFAQKWMEATDKEPPARVYKIGEAQSKDGIEWVKNEGAEIIPSVLENECQALPTVAFFEGKYHMFFCYRYATDFRTNIDRGYRLGYASSKDLKNWSRINIGEEMTTSLGDWDNNMQAYPNVFVLEEKLYLLYNGNEFGKYGFGLTQILFD